MSFHRAADGVVDPKPIFNNLVERVYSRLANKPSLTKDENERHSLRCYVTDTFERGLCFEQKL